jgi:predicted DNA-binding transcriptional regulator YafY
MQKTAHQLYELLNDRRSAISQADILAQLDISASTFKRALKELREAHKLTIYPPRHNGYRLDAKDRGKFLQGDHLLSKTEQLTLVQSYQLFSQLAKDPYHSAQLAPILEKVTELMGSKDNPATNYIDTLTSMERQGGDENFKTLSMALERQTQIEASYSARSTDSTKKLRVLSSQKLLRYKDNWYLIAWCHSRHALRTFSIERFNTITTLPKISYQMPEQEVQHYYSSTYGIFGGDKKEEAVIQFSAEISEWIKDELWHKDQTIEQTPDGKVILTLPIGEEITELTMDIMRYGQHVKILKPKRLQDNLIRNYQQSIKNLGSLNEP